MAHWIRLCLGTTLRSRDTQAIIRATPSLAIVRLYSVLRGNVKADHSCVTSGADTRGQPYLVFHPFHVAYDTLRPSDMSDNELDGDQSSSDESRGPAEGEVRYIPGFNANVDLFLSWQSARLEVLYMSPDEVLRRGFERVQAVLNTLPPELRWRGGLSCVPGTTWGHETQMFNLLINSLYLKSALLQHVGKTTSNYSHKVIIRSV